MRKQIICIYAKTKGADFAVTAKLIRLHFHYMDSTIPLLLKYEISTFLPFSVTVQADCCRIWLEFQIVGFSHAAAHL